MYVIVLNFFLCHQGKGIQTEDMRALLDYLSSVPNVSDTLYVAHIITFLLSLSLTSGGESP